MPKKAERMGKKPPLSGKRYPLNMRTTFEVRQKIETLAAASGRSLSQEAEYVVSRAFDYESAVMSLFGGPSVFALCQSLAIAMNDAARRAGIEPGADWCDRPEIFDQIEAAVNREIKFRLALHAGLEGLKK